MVGFAVRSRHLACRQRHEPFGLLAFELVVVGHQRYGGPVVRTARVAIGPEGGLGEQRLLLGG
jgi:hypothetical protein